MRDGRVEQIGRQEDLYERPATPFVAGFIGQSNLVRGNIEDNDLIVDGGSRIALAGRYRYYGPACLAIRPEAIRLAPPNGADARAEGTVKLCTYLGAVLEHVVRLDSGRDMIARGLGADTRRWAPDERVSLVWSATAERVYDDTDKPVANAGPATKEGRNGEWSRRTS
jgi:putative spermidine/putrescine transport system ATP-binding protein